MLLRSLAPNAPGIAAQNPASRRRFPRKTFMFNSFSPGPGRKWLGVGLVGNGGGCQNAKWNFTFINNTAKQVFQLRVDASLVSSQRINLYSAWRLVLNHHPSLVGGRRRHANSFCQVRETESYKCKFGNELLWWSCSFNYRSIQIFFMVADLSTTMWASRNDRQPSDSESIISFQLWHSVIFLTPFCTGPQRGSASVLICMTVSGCSRSRFLAAKGRSHLSGPFSDDAGYGARMMNGGHTGIDWWNRNGPPGG